MRKYKIYCLKHPITLEIRYIGVTIKDLKDRLYQHYYVAKNKKNNTHVTNWIINLIEKDLKPIIELVEETDKDNWEDREKYWISFYSNLTNISKGGVGLIINRSVSGNQRSSEAHRKKISILNKDFSLVKHFNSISEAADFLKVCKTAVGHVLNGNHSNVRGFLIVKQEDFINNTFVKEYKGRQRDVYQYDLSGKLVNVFKFLSEIFHYNNKFKTNHIHTACKNLWVHKDFIWSYHPLALETLQKISNRRIRNNIKI